MFEPISCSSIFSLVAAVVFAFSCVCIFIVNPSWVNFYYVNAYLLMKLFEIEIELNCYAIYHLLTFTLNHKGYGLLVQSLPNFSISWHSCRPTVFVTSHHGLWLNGKLIYANSLPSESFPAGIFMALLFLK